MTLPLIDDQLYVVKKAKHGLTIVPYQKKAWGPAHVSISASAT